MHSTAPLALTFDEIDDLLYFTRANEVQDLQQTMTELAQKHSCSQKDVLEAAIDPESGNTVLHLCSANNLTDLLPSLLSALGAAAEGSPSEFVNHGNQEGNTPLHWAAYNGHLNIVAALIKAGADMWQKNAAGHLAMFEAERADKHDVVQYLLEVGGKEVERAGEEDIVFRAGDVEGKASSSSAQAGADDVDMESAP